MLALLGAEPGSEAVAAELPGAVIGAVNLAEVVSKLAERRVAPDAIRRSLAALNIPVVLLTVGTAVAAGGLRPATRRHGLSLGDRACLARERGAIALTADGAWTLEVAAATGTTIRQIRPAG